MDTQSMIFPDPLVIEITPDPHHIVEACVGIIKRCFIKSNKYTLYVSYPTPHKYISSCSDDKIEYHIRQILESDGVIKLECDYEFTSNKVSKLYIEIYGDRYQKDCIRYFGRIFVIVNYYDIIGGNLIQTLTSKPYSIYEYYNLTKDFFIDIETLFLNLCGTNQPSSYITYGSLHTCPHSITPFGSSMVFHSDIKQLSLDYYRTYRQMFFGEFIYEQIAGIHPHEEYLNEIIAGETRKSIRISYILEYIEELSKNMDCQLYSYIRTINEHDAQQYRSINPDTIKHLLTSLPSSLYINYYQFREGIALTTDPLSTIWRAYKFIYENFAN